MDIHYLTYLFEVMTFNLLLRLSQAEIMYLPSDLHVMVSEWVKAPAAWCDPWPGHVLGVGSNLTRGMAGLRTLVKPLIKCIIN